METIPGVSLATLLGDKVALEHPDDQIIITKPGVLILRAKLKPEVIPFFVNGNGKVNLLHCQYFLRDDKYFAEVRFHLHRQSPDASKIDDHHTIINQCANQAIWLANYLDQPDQVSIWRCAIGQVPEETNRFQMVVQPVFSCTSLDFDLPNRKYDRPLDPTDKREYEVLPNPDYERKLESLIRTHQQVIQNLTK